MGFSAPPPSSPLSSRGVEDMSHQRPTCHNPSMRREQDRLDSFHTWTLSIITPAELAKAGFYYLGQGDRVACFSCGGQVCVITASLRTKITDNKCCLILLYCYCYSYTLIVPKNKSHVNKTVWSDKSAFFFLFCVSAVEQLGARGQSSVRTPETLPKLSFCPGGQSRQRVAGWGSRSCVWSGDVCSRPSSQQRIQPQHAAEWREAAHLCPLAVSYTCPPWAAG